MVIFTKVAQVTNAAQHVPDCTLPLCAPTTMTTTAFLVAPHLLTLVQTKVPAHNLPNTVPHSKHIHSKMHSPAFPYLAHHGLSSSCPNTPIPKPTLLNWPNPYQPNKPHRHLPTPTLPPAPMPMLPPSPATFVPKLPPMISSHHTQSTIGSDRHIVKPTHDNARPARPSRPPDNGWHSHHPYLSQNLDQNCITHNPNDILLPRSQPIARPNRECASPPHPCPLQPFFPHSNTHEDNTHIWD